MLVFNISRDPSDLTEILDCDITVRSKRTQLLRVLWDQCDHVSRVLANTGSCEAIVIFCDLKVSLTVWVTQLDSRESHGKLIWASMFTGMNDPILLTFHIHIHIHIGSTIPALSVLYMYLRLKIIMEFI